MKSLISFLVVYLVAAAVSGQTNGSAASRTIEIDGYAARVNDRIITRGDVMEAMAPLMPELYNKYQGAALEEELKKAFASVRDELVERTLVMEAYTARGGQIPDQYVNEEIRRIISDRFNGDEARFEQMLALEKRSRAEYMEIIREQIAVSIMMNEEVYRRARVTPEQVREAYEAGKEDYSIPEMVMYSLIVLNKGGSPEDEAVKQREAESIRKRLLEGADFAETARAFSEGSRATEGGAFSWMEPKDVRPELQEALRSLPAGEISEVISTENELFIMKVEARRQAAYKSFDEVRQSIKTDLSARERDRLKARWIARLKENNYIELYD